MNRGDVSPHYADDCGKYPGQPPADPRHQTLSMAFTIVADHRGGVWGGTRSEKKAPQQKAAIIPNLVSRGHHQ
jgi:hypothetical protein